MNSMPLFISQAMKWLMLLVFVQTFLNCQKTPENYRYSPYMLFQPPVWGTLEEARNTHKFNGMIEVSRFVGVAPTDAQKQAADELYNRTLANAKKQGWFEIKNAYRDGYVYEPNRDATHYPNYEYVFDGENLNPEKPEYLMYYNLDGKQLLAGVMFIVDDLYEHGEQIGGSETIWHFHDYGDGYCETFDFPEGHRMAKQFKKNGCEQGYRVMRSTEMMHVWFVDHPGGRFSSSMLIEDDVLKKLIEE